MINPSASTTSAATLVASSSSSLFVPNCCSSRSNNNNTTRVGSYTTTNNNTNSNSHNGQHNASSFLSSKNNFIDAEGGNSLLAPSVLAHENANNPHLDPHIKQQQRLPPHRWSHEDLSYFFNHQALQTVQHHPQPKIPTSGGGDDAPRSSFGSVGDSSSSSNLIPCTNSTTTTRNRLLSFSWFESSTSHHRKEQLEKTHLETPILEKSTSSPQLVLSPNFGGRKKKATTLIASCVVCSLSTSIFLMAMITFLLSNLFMHPVAYMAVSSKQHILMSKDGDTYRKITHSSNIPEELMQFPDNTIMGNSDEDNQQLGSHRSTAGGVGVGLVHSGNRLIDVSRFHLLKSDHHHTVVGSNLDGNINKQEPSSLSQSSTITLASHSLPQLSSLPNSHIEVHPPFANLEHEKGMKGSHRERLIDYIKALPYKHDPWIDFKLPYKNVTFSSVFDDSMKLRSWYIPASNIESNKAVILVHGAFYDRRDVMEHIPYIHKLGVHILLFDMINHGVSDGDNGCALACREWMGVIGAVDYLEGIIPNLEVAIFGTSTGGASSIIAASQDPRIKAVIAENPFADRILQIRDVLEVALYKNGWSHQLPKFMSSVIELIGNYIPSSFIKVVSVLVNWRMCDFRMGNHYHAVDAVKEMTQPMLLIHSKTDKVVHFKHSEIIRSAATGHVEFWVVEDASHSEIHRHLQNDFEQRVIAFLQKHLFGNQNSKPTVT
ncbi:hypothetical protein FDP41_011065 [Naegleria fowleri]|uniref:Serine aminopeptidase S33 domain-containing protein n=1 Tax=Naegleria fowleri TaxID=5763 RepID=A0A6A5C0U5_NAEFO|nr:uncharacterized protein FDP41_011065 [Naegleria fowleri]KAF0983087.1 hypothetical protein FDP41_011065 [Naegleria fowleri]